MIARGVRLLRFKCFILLMLFFCCCPLKRRKTSGLSLAGRPCVFFCALLGTRRRRFTLLLLLLHLLRSRAHATPARLHTSPPVQLHTSCIQALSDDAPQTLSRSPRAPPPSRARESQPPLLLSYQPLELTSSTSSSFTGRDHTRFPPFDPGLLREEKSCAPPRFSLHYTSPELHTVQEDTDKFFAHTWRSALTANDSKFSATPCALL